MGMDGQSELERIQRKYIKWTLGLDIRTPDCIIMEETKREKLKIRLAKRAVECEKRIEREREGGIVKECMKERKAGEGNQEGIRERQDHLKTCGFSQIGVEQLWREEEPAGKILRKRETEIQRQRQWNRIQKTRYNWKYKYLVTGELPKYLREERKNGDQKVIARERCSTMEVNGQTKWK